MNTVDTSEWGLFDFKSVFNYQRGKRLVTLDQIDGDIPYISSSKANNGIDNYIDPPDFMQIHENAITLNNSGSVGYCFYHQYKFVCSDHCTVITIKDKLVKMTPKIALFLKPVIESMKPKYNFAREISDFRLGKEKIRLPKNNERGPDWKYMETLVDDIAKNIIFNQPMIGKVEKSPIDTRTWGWFFITKLFDVKRGERLVEDRRIGGEIPLVTASSENNGIVDFLSYDEFNSTKKLFENKITVDMFFNVFYHKYRYFTDDNVHTLIPKFKEEENEFVMIFLITMLRKLGHKYGYGRQLRMERIELEQIKLPVIKKEVPDWAFMENYVKSLPYSSNLV